MCTTEKLLFTVPITQLPGSWASCLLSDTMRLSRLTNPSNDPSSKFSSYGMWLHLSTEASQFGGQPSLCVPAYVHVYKCSVELKPHYAICSNKDNLRAISEQSISNKDNHKDKMWDLHERSVDLAVAVIRSVRQWVGVLCLYPHLSQNKYNK